MNGVPSKEQFQGETALRTREKQLAWENAGDVDVFTNPAPYPEGKGWTRVQYDLAPGYNFKSSDVIMGSLFLKFQMEQTDNLSGVAVVETRSPHRVQVVVRIGSEDDPSLYEVIDFTKGPAVDRHQSYVDVLYNPVTQRTEAGTVSLTAAFDFVPTTNLGGVWLHVDYQSGAQQVAKLTAMVFIAYQSAILRPTKTWCDYPGEAVTEVIQECAWDRESAYSPISTPCSDECRSCSATSSEWILD